MIQTWPANSSKTFSRPFSVRLRVGRWNTITLHYFPPHEEDAYTRLCIAFDTNVSQRSVATFIQTSGVIFNNQFTANSSSSLPVKMCKSVKI